MLDAKLRPYIDPPLNAMGRRLASAGITANQITVAGMVIGIAGAIAIFYQTYIVALILILAGRILDGLDGAVARASQNSDFGGYLDILCDFVFYVSVPLAFGFSIPAYLPFAMALIAAFTLTGISFLAYAIMAEKRGEVTQAHGKKSFFYNSGMAEGTETIICFVLMCIFPLYFNLIAVIYTVMCVITVIQRTAAAHANFPNN